MAKRNRTRIILWLAVAGIVLIAAFVGPAIATDASSFCKTCHEMGPYYTAWAAGTHGHEDVPCIDCHVNPGLIARLAHKPLALLEVWAHFFGNTSFPLATPPHVPSQRCTRCHPDVKVNRKNFSHQLHASKGSCRDCHPTSGHSVSTQALKDAGIFNPNVTTTPFALKVAIVNGGSANLPGHVAVVCSTCHDMKTTSCHACHTPPHKERGDCSGCHKPGPRFAFSHPAGAADCSRCHKPPSNHPAAAAGKPCATCHSTGTWGDYSHPSAGAVCSDCHKPPANHFAGICSSCHKQRGVSWAFAHPSAGEHTWRRIACAKCHPNGYATSYCTCHKGKPPTD